MTEHTLGALTGYHERSVAPGTSGSVVVYRLSFDTERYQSLIVQDPNLLGTSLLRFDGSSKSRVWKPPPVYSPNVGLSSGDFLRLWGCTALVCGPRAVALLKPLPLCAEFLPLPFGGEELLVLNVLGDESCPSSPQPNLFRAAQGERDVLLCREGICDQRHEFKSVVERHRLTGLRFERLEESMK